MDTIRNALLAVYAGRADKRYGLSDVTQLQHALQAATLAEAAAEPPSVIVASLLHDLGHMTHELGIDCLERGINDAHEATGAQWLSRWFGAEVSEPVRLHVAAKRYLCSVEGHYDRLARDSRRSLELQGGMMNGGEISGFRAEPYADEAIRVRRFDDMAKNPTAQTPAFEYFLDRYVVPLARSPEAAR